MAIINQVCGRSIAERHFQMGLCPPVFIFITVSLLLRHVWHTLGFNMTHDLYMHMSISKRALMQKVLFCQDSCSLRTRSSANDNHLKLVNLKDMYLNTLYIYLHPTYVLTFTGLSIRAQAVASTTAAGSGLVAATQKADMGTSTRLSI